MRVTQPVFHEWRVLIVNATAAAADVADASSRSNDEGDMAREDYFRHYFRGYSKRRQRTILDSWIRTNISSSAPLHSFVGKRKERKTTPIFLQVHLTRSLVRVTMNDVYHNINSHSNNEWRIVREQHGPSAQSQSQ